MKPNDKVVCVDDNFHAQILESRFRFVGPIPVKNRVYTVEAVLVNNKGVRGLRLTGATVFCAGTLCGERETGFRAVRFRKLDEVTQAIKNREIIYCRPPVHKDKPVLA